MSERCIKIFVEDLGDMDILDCQKYVVNTLEPSLSVKRVQIGDNVFINPAWVER